jgi:hypothetical protein
MAGVAGKGSKLFVTEEETFSLTDVVANLTSIGEIGGETEEIETTDLDSGEYKEFSPGLKDGGSVDVTGNFVAGGTGYARLKALFDSSEFANFGISHPVITEANCGFKGYVASLKIGERTPSGLLSFTASIRVSGAIGDFTVPIV